MRDTGELDLRERAPLCVMCNNIVYINRGLPPTEKSDTFRHKKELILMPWEERNVTKAMLRKEFVERVLAHEKSKKALCLEYGISRPTGDKWIKRYRENSSCEELSREPHHRANRTSPEMEALVIKTRKENYDACALVVHTLLKRQGIPNVPCVRTINNIFHRYGLITPDASQAATPYTRFEKEAPNDMWQTDFIGHFALKNQRRCHPLMVMDDHSRFNLSCHAQYGETFGDTIPVMRKIFLEYGMPKVILCDNGNPWGTVQSTGFTKYEVWMMERGVLVIHGRIKHPQTQGKQERMNQTFRKGCIQGPLYKNLRDAQSHFDAFRDFYNNRRPHTSLTLETPASQYTSSLRKYPRRIRSWDYGEGLELRRIKSSGYLTYGGQGYFLSEALGNKIVAVRETKLDGNSILTLYFRQFIIGKIDVNKQVFLMKRAYLIHNDPRLEGKLKLQ